MDTGAQDAALGAIRDRWGREQDHYPASLDGFSYDAARREADESYADIHTLLDALDAAETRQAALVALAHDLAELEHGARAEQMQALHRLGIVVTLDEHLARARAFADKQHARIDALAALGEGGA